MTDKIYVFHNGKKQEAKGESLDYIISAQAEAQAQADLVQTQETAKATARVSALAKLADLGLTAEEIASL